MLIELQVKDFAIIDNVKILFQPGFNILSGETGAGKSVLLKSLSLLMGGKAKSQSVRTGKDSATIEGAFDLSHRTDIKKELEKLEIDTSEDVLVVRRVISSQGKSRVYLNGSLSNLSILQGLVTPMIEVTGPSAPLIEMTGQHESRHLLSKGYHLDLLDRFAGTWSDRRKVEDLYDRWQEVQIEISKLEESRRHQEQKLDYLLFQQKELRNLDLQPDEVEEIENKVSKLKNASKTTAFAQQVEDTLYNSDNSITSRLQSLVSQSYEFLNVEPEMVKNIENLKQAEAILEDVAYNIRGFQQMPTESLEEAESRLSDLRKIQNKYGQSYEEIQRALEEIEREISQIENSDQILSQLQDEEKSLQLALKKQGEELHAQRTKAAKKLQDKVNKELDELNMKGVLFHVDTSKHREIHRNGLTDTEFQTKTSSKDQPRALAKFASGGELSRILLSLKQVVGRGDEPRTYLFDEVDTGVSGETAEKVGKKLRSISQGQQVICITHLPQVAAFANAHFYIEKQNKKGHIEMNVAQLSGDHQVREIARLISGEKITKTSLAHAEQLLTQH